jgi:hypothetical protein
MKQFNTISTNGTPFEYNANATRNGTEMCINGVTYLLPMSLDSLNKLMQTMLSIHQVHDTMSTLTKKA